MTDFYVATGILCAGSTIVIGRGLMAQWQRLNRGRKAFFYSLIGAAFALSLPPIATPWEGFPPAWLIIAAGLVAVVNVTIGLIAHSND